MKTRKIAVAIAFGILITWSSFPFIGCSNDSTLAPFTKEDQSQSSFAQVKGISKGHGVIQPQNSQTTFSSPSGSEFAGVGQKKQFLMKNTYPQMGEMTLTYDASIGGYQDGTMRVANGSLFHVESNSLIPPPEDGMPSQITLTMEVTKEEYTTGSMLIYTFAPSGTKFTTPAEIRLDWTDLGLSSDQLPEFYYIDSAGNFILQSPEKIDQHNRKIILYVDHFSRYALAHSE